MTKDERIAAKRAEFLEVYKDLPEEKMKVAQALIDQCIFMAVLLEDLQTEINKNGVSETYINGQHQQGRKQSTAVKTYNSLIGKYATITDKLLKLIPEEKQQLESKETRTQDLMKEEAQQRKQVQDELQRRDKLFLAALGRGEVTQDQYREYMDGLENIN